MDTLTQDARRIFLAGKRKHEEQEKAKKEKRKEKALLEELDRVRRDDEFRERAKQANEHICPID